MKLTSANVRIAATILICSILFLSCDPPKDTNSSSANAPGSLSNRPSPITTAQSNSTESSLTSSPSSSEKKGEPSTNFGEGKQAGLFGETEGVRISKANPLIPDVYFKSDITYTPVSGGKGAVAIVIPEFRGSQALKNPKDVIVNLRKEQYIPWGTDSSNSAVMKFQLFSGMSWIEPKQVARFLGEGKHDFLPEGVNNVNVRVYPGNETKSFSFWFVVPERPSRFRLIIENGEGFDTELRW
jgi:hypothetical protein